MRSYYLRILGLSESATQKEIKSAYRKMSKMYHPDVNSSPDAVERFIEIDKAYDYLSEYRATSDYVVEQQVDPRAEWRMRVKRKKWEEEQAKEQLLKNLLRWYSYFLYVVVVINTILVIDLVIPAKSVPQDFVRMELGYSRKGSARNPQKYWYDDVYFKQYYMRFDKQLVAWDSPNFTYTVYASRIVNAPKYLVISDATDEIRLDPAVGVFNFWVYIIPIILLTSAVFFFAGLSSDNRLTLAIFLIVPILLQWYVLIQYA